MKLACCELLAIGVLLSVQGSLRVESATVSAGDNKGGRLGDNHNVSITCTYTLGAGETADVITIQRRRVREASYNDIAYFHIQAGGSSYADVDLVDRADLILSRGSATIRLNSIQCDDAATYRCSFTYMYIRNQVLVQVESTMVLVIEAEPEGKPIFKSGINLPFTEDQTLKLTCEADVGLPAGNLLWFGYKGNETVDLTSEAEELAAVQVNSGPRYCVYRRESTLSLNLTSFYNKFAFRCAVNHSLHIADADQTCVETPCVQTQPIILPHGAYSDSCTSVGDSAECGPGLVCVSGTGQLCLCQEGNYFTGSICTSTDALKPTGFTSSSQTDTSVTLSWTSPDAPGYTNSYVINYSVQGGSVQTYNVVGEATAITVPGLSPGTIYIFSIVRSITRYGRTQTVAASDATQAQTKLDYGSSCDAQASECRADLVCISDKCLCADGQYYVNGGCLSTTELRPSILSAQPTSTTSVTISWNSPDATGYISSFVIKYTKEGTTLVETSPVSGDVSTHLVTGLKAGTSYTFIVVRSITREGRTQTVIDSLGVVGATKKILYGAPCVWTGTCQDLNIDCYSSACRCNPGYFWKDTCLPNANISPGNVNTERLSTTQLRVTWIASAYPDVVAGYLVELSPPVSSENIVITGTSATISSLTPGERYMITVTTRSNYLNRGETVSAGAVFETSNPDAAVDLSVSDVTSRAASLSWKRPVNTYGSLYKYTIEVFNSSTCVQRINIQCSECMQTMTINEGLNINCGSETETFISKSDLNNVNFVVPYDLTLLPDTAYDVVVAAYNEEGKGHTDQVIVQTDQEVPGDPTEFRYVSKTSESVELTWSPPEPRPGVTSYIITGYEWDEDNSQYTVKQVFNNLGFCSVSVNITGLSSYWKYTFEMYAQTNKGVSNTVSVPEVTTDESAPTAIENLEHQQIVGVYNQYQLSWRCRPQKDGRNGVIQSATVIKSSFTRSVDVNPAVGSQTFGNTDCSWNERITVTPEFNYTFEVFISNSIQGESTTIQGYMPAGPATLSSASAAVDKQQHSNDPQTIPFVFCPSCILDPKNGRVTSSGIIVCKGSCNRNRRKRQVPSAADYDSMKTWSQSKKNNFSGAYRATPPGWLASVKDSDNIKYTIGEDTKCSHKAVTTFCNGPLEKETQYIIIVFACTAAGCDESDKISVSTSDDSLPVSIIAAIIVSVVLVVLAAVLLVVYIKVIRPHSQRQRRTQYVSDTSPKDKCRPIIMPK